VANYNQSLVAALREVADAVHSARSLDAQIASATQARDAAHSALQLADTRYRAGLGTQLDVLSAQRPLLQLEQQLASLRAQRYVATVDLDRALGGGVAPVGPEAASESHSSPDLAGAPTP
jgi:outer membrane protein TolC